MSSLKKMNDSQLKKTVGDVHQFKKELVGGRVAHFDTYKDTSSGYLFLLPKGGGTPIPTYYNVNW
ncbi:polymorphic toxin type 33 domain-containing protein [Streptomyces canus]|uniref:polymorphic toxin type 33 domain-containing protein n=1 Tax=Streptomyces canus TaxID=58343 RepID=UPI002E328D5F|nr:polymorphic toxin type 33 domain-containing protein [Streptomyces canus]